MRKSDWGNESLAGALAGVKRRSERAQNHVAYALASLVALAGLIVLLAGVGGMVREATAAANELSTEQRRQCFARQPARVLDAGSDCGDCIWAVTTWREAEGESIDFSGVPVSSNTYTVNGHTWTAHVVTGAGGTAFGTSGGETIPLPLGPCDQINETVDGNGLKTWTLWDCVGHTGGGE